MTDGPWTTVSFTPATEPYFVHKLDAEGTGTSTQRVVGWLVQRQYDEADRIVAGILEPELGRVFPVDCEESNFVGVYPADEPPSTKDIEEQSDIRARRRRGDPVT